MTVYTNTVPGGFLRAPGDVQTLFGFEAHIDTIARELKIDPLEFRMLNAMREGVPDLDGRAHHDANGVAVLETFRNHVDWNRKREPGRGHGIAFTARHIGGGNTSVKLGLLPGGVVDVRTGCTEVGVGMLTMTARVVAQALEIDPSRVRVRRDSTANVPVDPGVGGSRTTHILGEAAFDAATQLRRQLEGLGYPQKGWDDATTELLRAGEVDITGTYVDTHKHGVDPDWTDVSLFYVDLTVDKDTGTIDIHDVLLVMDAGTIINPVAFRGQINGGFIFGVGHALTEELRVDGGKIVNLNLGDYKLPTQMDVPPLRVVTVHAAHGPGPWGAKMVGELTTSGVAPAFANAVADACGARITELPITAERIFAALHQIDVRGRRALRDGSACACANGDDDSRRDGADRDVGAGVLRERHGLLRKSRPRCGRPHHRERERRHVGGRRGTRLTSGGRASSRSRSRTADRSRSSWSRPLRSTRPQWRTQRSSSPRIHRFAAPETSTARSSPSRVWIRSLNTARAPGSIATAGTPRASASSSYNTRRCPMH